MRYQTPDGNTFQGETYEDIVAAMANEKFDEPSSMASYMRATATRANEMHGNEVDPSTAETFVTTLTEAGLLEEV